MKFPLPEDDAKIEDATELLATEIGALAAHLRFDLAIVARVDGDRLVPTAAFGPFVRDTVPDGAAPLAACPTESEALRTRSAVVVGPLPAGVDALSGLELPGDRFGLVVPLFLGRRAMGVLGLARVRGGAFNPDDLTTTLAHGRALSLALHAVGQSVEIDRLRSHGDERISILESELHGASNQVIEQSSSAAMRDVAWRARQVAPTDTPVLILGETGVGKEWLAHAIHSWSSRARQPFVKMNCAAIPAGTLDSELFGHEKGAFTGATRARPGRFQIADGGTLLLDEVGELPLEVQAKLLRVLQDGTFFPVGSDKQVKVNVRILAATLVDLERAIGARTFRDDLYYRLNVFPLRVPPLRARMEDLPMLCEVLLAQQAARTGRRRMRLTPEGMAKLSAYDWPGNLRELGNVLERAAILSHGSDDLGAEVIDLPDRSPWTPVGRPAPVNGTDKSVAPSPRVGGRDFSVQRDSEPDLPAVVSEPAEVVALDDAQRIHIERALQVTKGKIYGEDGAAKLLGMKPSTLQSRMRKLGVRRPAPQG